MSEPTNHGLRSPQAVGFGELLDTIFSLYRTHFLSFFGIASGYFITIAVMVSIIYLILSDIRFRIPLHFCQECVHIGFDVE